MEKFRVIVIDKEKNGAKIIFIVLYVATGNGAGRNSAIKVYLR